MWEWLGEVLAVDFANTIRRYGNEFRDCLRADDDLAEWARHQDGAVPVVGADGRLAEVIELRDAVIRVLHGARRAGPGEVGARDLRAATARVNAAARAVPLVAQLRDGAIVTTPAARADPLDELLARVAASAVEVAGGDHFVGFCDAPSCGMFFEGGRSGRRWCSDTCGTRARVARHAHRHRRA